MRLVLDTNVVASAVLWGGVPRLLLQAGREKQVSSRAFFGVTRVSVFVSGAFWCKMEREGVRLLGWREWPEAALLALD